MSYQKKIKDARHEQSVFLERQTVRKRRDWTRRLRQVERGLISAALVLGGLALLYGFYLVVFTGSTFAVKRIIIDGEEVPVRPGDCVWIRPGHVHQSVGDLESLIIGVPPFDYDDVVTNPPAGPDR